MNHSPSPSPLTTLALVIGIFMVGAGGPLGLLFFIAAVMIQRRHRRGIRAHRAAVLRKAEMKRGAERMKAARWLASA